ncbi:MAG: ABC transporter permease subunit, partial [Eggerthellaceae bacterium]|nr:ABC transporter permease subunit [Eggerthellaceae bacterium]
MRMICFPIVKSASWIVARIYCLIQLALVILPVLAIFYLSFMPTNPIMTQYFPTGLTGDNYINVFTSARTFKPVANSLEMSLMCVAAGLLITVPVFLISRRAPASKKTRGGKASKAARAGTAALSWLLMLPWCMPASVIAIGLINVFANPSIFSFGTALLGTFEILPIVYKIMSLPLLLTASDVAAAGVQQDCDDASRNLGAGTFRTFLNIAVPAIGPGILSGAILVFVRAMGEYTMPPLHYGVY